MYTVGIKSVHRFLPFEALFCTLACMDSCMEAE